MALDLKRAAIGYHSGSKGMADLFVKEVVKKKSLLDTSILPKSMQKILNDFSVILLSYSR